MKVYFLVFVIGLIYYVFVRRSKRLSKDGRLLAIFFTYLALFAGLGDMIGGYDRYIYGEAFDYIANITWGSRNYAKALYLVSGTEYGYFAWEILMSFITTNRYIFILFTTFFIYFLFYKAFRKHIESYPLACILFLGLMFFLTFTYLRQMIAIGLAWQGIEYVWKRHLVKFIFWVALAATFHTSVLIFGIVYFIPFKKFSKYSMLRLFAVCLIIGFTSLPHLIINIAGDTTGKGLDYVEQEQGFRIEYILEIIFFVFIIFSRYKDIELTRKNMVFLNMCYVLCAILLVFMRFGQGGRFAWPFYIGVFYLLPKLLVRNIVSPMYRGFVVLVFFSLFTRIAIAWAPMQVPYKTFLTNGMPAGDGALYTRYEYDHDYTINKFYKAPFTFLK